MTLSPPAYEYRAPQHSHPNVLRAHRESQECVQHAPSLTKGCLKIPSRRCHAVVSVNCQLNRTSKLLGDGIMGRQTTSIDVRSHLS